MGERAPDRSDEAITAAIEAITAEEMTAGAPRPGVLPQYAREWASAFAMRVCAHLTRSE